MVEFKDINELTEASNIAGTEKVPVSGTKYVLLDKIKGWIINSLKTTGLDLGGKQIKNAGFEVVTSLPTTNNFLGRQVTYQGRSYIWDGSAWKCDAITVRGYDVINDLPVNDTTLFTGGETSDFPTYCSSGGLQSMRNILDLIPLNKIIVEYSDDLGVTWVDFGLSDSQKGALFYDCNESNPIQIQVGRWLRITFDTVPSGTSTLRYVTLYSGDSYTILCSLLAEAYVNNAWKNMGTEKTQVIRNKTVYGHNYGYSYSFLYSSVAIYYTNKFRFTIKNESSNTYRYQLAKMFWFGSTAKINPLPYLSNDYLWNATFKGSVQSNETINFDTSNIEPTQTGTVTKTSTWLWQYLTQTVNFLWLKLKDLFPTTQATTHNYLPKIDNTLKKLVKSNIQDDGTTLSYEGNLDLKGNQIKNVAIEVVTSLPTTNNFVGRQVTYQGRSYIWDGSAWKCDSDYLEVGGRNLVSNTSDEYKTINNTGWGGNMGSFIPEVGDTVIARIYIKPEQQNIGIQFVYLQNGIQKESGVGNRISAGEEGYAVVIFTFPEGTTSTWIQLRNTSNVGYTTSNQVQYKKLKAEKGNIATDWTPAPEDKADVDHNHDATYLGITATAADSDKLDGKDASKFAQLEDGKIKTSNLPDYLLGQVLYGGSINSSQTCTLSSLYKDKFGTTDTTRLLSNLNASLHVGVYFIASGSFMLNGTIDVEVGDWVISNGNAWGKIDNTDAVASVNGKTGVINLSYEDIGDIPEASDTKIGGIKIGFVEGLDANFLKGKEPSDFAEANHNHDATYLKRTGGAMSGILDMGGNNLKNAGFEVVTTLPTTNRFVGRRVTYQGENYVWTGSAWNSLALYVQDFPMTKKYIPFDNVTTFGWKSGAGLIITMYQRYGTNAFGVSDSYDCMELFECSYSTPNKTDIDTGEVYPNPISNAKIAKRNIWTDSPDVIKYRHKLTEGISGSIGTFPPYTNITTWLNASNNGVYGYILKNSSSIFTDLAGGTLYYLHLAQLNSNIKTGMNYTFVGRASGKGTATLQLTDTKSLENISLTEGQIVLFDFVKVANGVVLYRNLEVR